jgi:hypothetical protein
MENTHFGCLRHGLAKELDLEISMCGMKSDRHDDSFSARI